MTDASQTVADWTQDNLQPLIDKFNQYLVTTGKSYQLTLNGSAPTVKGFLQQGAIVIATDVWSRLREFVSWLVSEYALVDNQAGAQLGVSLARVLLPFVSANSMPTGSLLLGSYYMPTYSEYRNVYAAVDPTQLNHKECYVFAAYAYGNSIPMVFSVPVDFGSISRVWMYIPGRGSVAKDTTLTVAVSGRTVRYGEVDWVEKFADDSFPIFDTLEDGIMALMEGSSEFSGIMADTTTVAVPAALEDGVQWGGLVVEGSQDVASPSVVEGIVSDAIEARDKPAVRTVEVTVAQGTEIDPNTGETDPPVVITPFPPVPSSELELGEDILSALEEHFPFSVPWDLYKIFSRLDAEPVAPRWVVPMPAIGGLEATSFVIDIGDTAFDTWAPYFRALVGVAICISLLLAATRFIKR